MTQWLVPPRQQGPGLGQQFAEKAATKIAADQVAKLGLTAAGNAAAGPVGGAVAGAASDLVAPLAGQLVGSLFEQGGSVKGKKKKGSIWDSIKEAASYAWKNDNTLQARAKKPQYKAIGGLTPGPLGMSDLMMAGKDKDISKVKLKKNKGDMSEEVEYTYHAPLAAKPNPGE